MADTEFYIKWGIKIGSIVFPLIILILFIAMGPIKIVPQSENWTIQRFGKYRRTLKPGLNVVIPFVDKVGAKISMREQVLDVPPQYIITADNATVTVDGVVFYQVFSAFKAAYQVEDLQGAITQLAITNVRTVMGEMELDKLLCNREVINAKLLAVIDEATDPWGVKVIRLEIKDIQPPEDIQEAMGRQMKSERDRRVTITNAEADRQASILRAEGESRAQILTAQARKTAKILDAEGNKQEAYLKAQAREREAKAEAASIASVSDALKAGTTDASKYFLDNNYIDSIKEIGKAPNGKVLFLPFEAASLMSTVGSLTDVAKTMLKESPQEMKKALPKNKK